MCKLRAKAKMRCNANLLNVMLCYELQISELFVKNILDCRIYHAIDDIPREWISFCCCCCCRSWRENKCVFHTLERDRMILAIKWAIKWYNMSWTPFFNSEQRNEREKKKPSHVLAGYRIETGQTNSLLQLGESFWIGVWCTVSCMCIFFVC